MPIRFLIRGLLIVACLYATIEYFDGVNLIVDEGEFTKAFFIICLFFLLDEAIAFPIFNKVFAPPKQFSIVYEITSFIFSVINVYIVEAIYPPFIIESFLAVVILTLILIIIRGITTKKIKQKD